MYVGSPTYFKVIVGYISVGHVALHTSANGFDIFVDWEGTGERLRLEAVQ